MYYYVVRSATAATPTASQVEALYDSYVVDGTSYAVHKNGTIAVTADVASSVTLTGYDDNEALSVFLVAKDSNGNLQTLTTELDLVMGDDNPPTYASGYPYADSIDADSFHFSVVLNEAGTVHFAVLPKGTTAPTTVAEITGCTVTGAVPCSPGGGVYVPARPYYLSSSLYHVSFNLRSVADLSALAAKNGIEPHAGHGLTYENVQPIAAIPQLAELNIGHYLVGEAVFVGLEAAVRRMRELMDEARG